MGLGIEHGTGQSPCPCLRTHWWSLWALSWQSRQVRVSQLSQNNTRGSCLCTLQYTVRSPSRDLAGPRK